MEEEKIELTEEQEELAEEYFMNGSIALNKGQYDDAIEWYHKSLDINDRDSVIYLILGYTYLNIYKEYAKALDFFDKANYYCDLKLHWQMKERDKYLELEKQNIKKNTSDNYFESVKEETDSIQKAIKFCESFILYIKEQKKETFLYKAFAYSSLGYKESAATSIIQAKLSILNILSEYDDDMSYLIPEMLERNADPFFSKVVALDDKYREQYKSIYIKSLEIVASLYVEREDEKRVAHYTRKSVAEIILSQNKPFRLNTVATANDPKEGKPLLQFLEISEDNIPEDYQAFVGCFIFDPDSLNQFRLYGKENGEEATGVSLVFDKEYFSKKISINPSLSRLKEFIVEEENVEQTALPDPNKEALFRCVYLDPVTGQVISVGHKEEYTFYREKYKEKNKIYKKTIAEYNRYKKDIDNLVVELCGSLNDLKNEIDILLEKVEKDTSKTKVEDEKRKARQTVCELLIHLRYLVKHVAFKEEQECRLIRVEPLAGNDEIKYDEKEGRMYVEYLPVASHVTDVYFGPKAKGMELFKDLMKYKGLDHIECHQCEHPFFS